MLINTFSAFERYWAAVRPRPLAEQIERWASDYMRPWPELYQKQVDDYAADGFDWRAVAGEHVFPHLDRRYPAMRQACQSLLASWDQIYAAAHQRFGLAEGVVAFAYVGIGLGAGWAATYGGRPAVLFGLENMAEEGWVEPETVAGLIAHELGHLLHNQLRAVAGLADGSGPLWQLYQEGFAMWVEQLTTDSPSWHFLATFEPTWLAWCQANRSWLAGEFLRRLAADPDGKGGELRPFFGSWYELCGHKQTGYYLGWEVVQGLHGELSLVEMARLADLDPIMGQLRKFA
jgi:hypothetical protein